jgi:hypothetical protein
MIIMMMIVTVTVEPERSCPVTVEHHGGAQSSRRQRLGASSFGDLELYWSEQDSVRLPVLRRRAGRLGSGDNFASVCSFLLACSLTRRYTE